MADIHLGRDQFAAAAGDLPVSERKIFITIVLLDVFLAVVISVGAIADVVESVTKPVFCICMMASLAVGMTVPLWSKTPQDLLSDPSTIQFHSLLKTYLYLNLFGVLLGGVSPGSFASVKGFLLITPVALVAHHLAWRSLLRLFERSGLLRRKPIVLLFSGPASGFRRMAGLLRGRYRVVGEFALNADQPIETVQRALGIAERLSAQELFLMETNERTPGLMLEALSRSPIPVYVVPSGLIAGCVGPRCRHVGAQVIFELRRTALNAAEQRLKRLIDILVAMVGLILLSPIMLCVAVLIRWDSPGPIIYRQRRLGLLGQSFPILKFRTMNIWRDGSDIVQATRGDTRITRVGRWLRLTSIDELPQLINVLKGDMSIVGPRPHAISHDVYYSKRIHNYLLRQRVRPGLTGWAQANYHRGETATLEKMEQRINLDLWYIDHWAPTLDLAIMLRTAVHLFRLGDAY